MPKKRAADNVELNVKYPQEEEFGLGNMCHYCYYYFWLFPHQVKEYYNKFIKFKVDKKIKEEWKEQYLRLVKKAIYDLKRPRFISKNPPNTGRIPIILEMFPNAKFIYIKRDPITTFLSTKRFFKSTIPALQFQNINENELESFIVNIYHRLLKDYKFDKKQIPNGNLIEISYEEFLKQPLKNLKQIYHSLGLDGFFKAQSLFKQYINSQKNFKKKDYILSQEEFARIKKLLNLPDDYKPLNGIKVE